MNFAWSRRPRFRPQLTLNFTVVLVAKKGERGLKPEQDIFPKSAAKVQQIFDMCKF